MFCESEITLLWGETLVLMESFASRTLISHKNWFLVKIFILSRMFKSFLIKTTMKSNRMCLFSRENWVTSENKVKLEMKLRNHVKNEETQKIQEIYRWTRSESLLHSWSYQLKRKKKKNKVVKMVIYKMACDSSSTRRIVLEK